MNATDRITELLSKRAELVAFVRARVESEAVAEEIVQSAFVRGVEQQEDLRDDESAPAWFYRILRNAIVDHYRRRDARGRALQRLAAEPEVFEQAGPDERNRTCACVKKLADDLQPGYAEVLNAVDLEGESIADVARRVGITANNATVRLHRARKALRERVLETCQACATHGCVDCTCGASS